MVLEFAPKNTYTKLTMEATVCKLQLNKTLEDKEIFD